MNERDLRRLVERVEAIRTYYEPTNAPVSGDVRSLLALIDAQREVICRLADEAEHFAFDSHLGLSGKHPANEFDKLEALLTEARALTDGPE